MLLNYAKILGRSLVKNKVYTFVNVVGLALGITSFILIMLYVMDELNYDRYHSKADRIYRLCMVYDFGGVGENSASQPFPVAYTLKGEYPDMVEEAVRIFNFQSGRHLVEFGEKRFNESRLFFADSTFFTVFTHRFLKGDPATAMDEPNSAVITESTAQKYFGNENPLGKVLKYEGGIPMKVTGVIRDVPHQSHFIFDIIVSMSTVRKMFNGRLPKTWVWNPCWTYIVLADGVNPATLAENFPAFTRNFFYDAQKESVTLYLQDLKDIHLHSRLDYEIEPNSNHAYVIILSVIATFLLLIASINFMNLATATAGTRTREIGIRKVTGAQRIQLVFQFLGESLFMTLLAFVLSLILTELIIPTFNEYTGTAISFDTLSEPWNIFGLILLWLLLGTISGTYPAFFMSSFKPITVLRGVRIQEIRSGIARKALVVFQFVISIGLIVSTLTIFMQVRYMRSADLGFNPENVILLPVEKTGLANVYITFKNKILQNPDIVSVTTIDDIIGASHNTHEFRHEGMTEKEWRFYPTLVVDYDFLRTFEIELIAGRDYSRDFKTDPMKALLINESMVRHLGWPSPEAALGKEFRSYNGDEKIVGVFKDFQPTSLREPSGPFVLNIKEHPGEVLAFLKYIAIRTTGHNDKEVISFLETTWSDFEAQRPFHYLILDNELDRLYHDEASLGALSLIFTLLIIFIATLGLFGLASFMAEKRTREIGIRKVMGASMFDIVLLLQQEFVYLILLAMCIAWPLAYYLTDQYFLSQFATRIPFNPWIYLFSGIFSLAVAMSIITFRAVYAASINPADTLKYE
jgi:putative ABC transport system permease protein